MKREFALAVLAVVAAAPTMAQFAPLTPVSPGESHDTVPLIPIDPANAEKVPLGQVRPVEGPALPIRVGSLVCPVVTAAGSTIKASCNFNSAIPGPVIPYSVSATLSPGAPSSAEPWSLVWSVFLPANGSPNNGLAGDYEGFGSGKLDSANGSSLLPLNIPGAGGNNLAPFAVQVRLEGP